MRSSSVSCWSSNKGSSQWNWARAWLMVVSHYGEGCQHSMPRRMARLFKWRHQFPFFHACRRTVSAQTAELAAVEDQRRRRRKLAQLDLADENDVVAFRIAA